MADRANARLYLEQRIAEYDLGVENGHNMTPDTVAIATLLLDVDERLDQIMERLERRCCWWIGEVAAALLRDKAAMAVIIGALLTILATFAHSILSFFNGG